MAKKKASRAGGPKTKELRQVRDLLMLLLIKMGASLEELQYAVRMDKGDISKILPIRKIKKLPLNGLD